MQQFSSLLAIQLVLLGVCHAVPGVLGQHSWPAQGARRVSLLEAQAVQGAGQGNSGSVGLMLPLRQKQGWVRSRQLLRAAALGVNGSVREVGYFYVTLGIGNPSRDFQLIIDTGSTITYVPCADCKHCGKHRDAPFDPKQSKTAHMLACGVPKCNCGSPACQCMNNKCYYSRTYAERSSSDGFLLEDVMAFPDVQSRGSNGSDVTPLPGQTAGGAPPARGAGTAGKDVRIVFGCEYSETGEIYRQAADGILGLGNNNNALQSQLVEQRVIDDTFSLCFGYPDGGMLLLGDVQLQRESEMVYTHMKPAWQTHYYTITISHLAVGDQKLAVDPSIYAQGYGAVLDSGTTFTYLPTAAFNAFRDAVSAAVASKGVTSTPGPDPQYRDICWKGAPEDVRQLGSVFPLMYMVFMGNATLTMRPLQYLFKAGGGVFCLGVFDNNNQGTLIGGITVRDVLVKYDRKHNRAGFLPLNSCSELQTWVQPVSDGPVLTPGSAEGEAQQQQAGSGAGTQQADTGQQGGSQAPAPQPQQTDTSKAGQDGSKSQASQQQSSDSSDPGSGAGKTSSGDGSTDKQEPQPTKQHSVVKVLDAAPSRLTLGVDLPMTIMVVAVLGVGIAAWYYRAQLRSTLFSIVSPDVDDIALQERQGLLAKPKQPTKQDEGTPLEPLGPANGAAAADRV